VPIGAVGHGDGSEGPFPVERRLRLAVLSLP
jgi:hypothetical protein